MTCFVFFVDSSLKQTTNFIYTKQKRTEVRLEVGFAKYMIRNHKDLFIVDRYHYLMYCKRSPLHIGLDRGTLFVILLLVKIENETLLSSK